MTRCKRWLCSCFPSMMRYKRWLHDHLQSWWYGTRVYDCFQSCWQVARLKTSRLNRLLVGLLIIGPILLLVMQCVRSYSLTFASFQDTLRVVISDSNSDERQLQVIRTLRFVYVEKYLVRAKDTPNTTNSLVGIANAGKGDRKQKNMPISKSCVHENEFRNDTLDVIINDLYFLVTSKNICLEEADDKRESKVLIAVHSAAENGRRRNAIRNTWGKQKFLYDMNAVLVFICGVSADKDVNSQLADEVRSYRDIAIANFFDTYRNMTFKALAAMKWYMMYCKDRRYILKLDDDAFVNYNQFNMGLSFLESFVKVDYPLVACDVNVGAPIQRKPEDKWCVQQYDLQGGTFPPYCTGLAIIYNNISIHAIYEAGKAERFFWIDDVLLTGLITNRTGIQLHNISRMYAVYPRQLELYVYRKTEKQYMFFHTSEPFVMYMLDRLLADENFDKRTRYTW